MLKIVNLTKKFEFPGGEILAIRNLNMLGWLDARPSAELPLNEETLLDV